MGTVGCGEGPPRLRHKGCALSGTDVKRKQCWRRNWKRAQGIVFFAECRKIAKEQIEACKLGCNIPTFSISSLPAKRYPARSTGKGLQGL
jgi:hypothetical protein